MKKITIHTDGGCEGNPGPGGWAAVLEYGGRTKEVSGGEAAVGARREAPRGRVKAGSAAPVAASTVKVVRHCTLVAAGE